MKVNPGRLATVLNKTPAAISMAVSRGKLNKTLDGLIDLDDAINHDWIVKRLAKLPEYQQQGCEIPQEISALFEATPLTANGKSKGNAEATAPPAPAAPASTGESAPDLTEVARDRAAREVASTQRTLDKARAREATAKADTAEIRAAEARRELIKINPFARLLFNIKAAERVKVLNAVPNIAQMVLDDIKSALDKDKSDTEMLMQIKEIWQGELADIFEAADKELKNKIRQAKNELHVTDTDEDEIGIDDAA